MDSTDGKEGPSIIESYDPKKFWRDVEIARCKYCKAECSIKYVSGLQYNCPVCRHRRERDDIYYVTEPRETNEPITHEGWIIKQWRTPILGDASRK